MRILVSAEGSRGDLQPMIELASALSAAGHDARLCGPPDFASQAAARGVHFHAFGESIQEFLRDRAAVVDRSAPSVLAEGFRYARRSLRARLATLLDLAGEADLAIAAGVELVLATAAERRGIPYRYVVYAPVLLPSRAYGPAFAHWQSLPPLVNRALWATVMGIVGFSVRRLLAPLRREHGLDAPGDVLAHLLGERPVIAADRALSPVPPDVQFAIQQIPALHPLEGDPLPPKLAAFLAAGPPPVYVGFGSMPDADPTATTRVVLEAVERLGVRAVIGAGWAGLGGGALPDGVLVAGPVSHPTLFPRCAAIVHHGGAGTTTTAARAGVPQVVVPHILDQFYWARRVELLGLGVSIGRRRQLDAARLAAALEAVVDNELLAGRCAELGRTLREEAAAAAPPAAVFAG